MTNKILVYGSQGWLGGLFCDYLIKQGIKVVKDYNDINWIKDIDPEITTVVNFAASASPDWCEKNKNEAFKNNVLGAINIANICKVNKAKYVFISSACIFKSKDENDVQYEDAIHTPSCFYTTTKSVAEKLIREIDETSLIVRLRLPISEIPHERNLLNKIASYKKLIDCQESVTVVEDFIAKLTELILKNESGEFNLVNEGTISPAEIGKLIGSQFDVITRQDLNKQMSSGGGASRVSVIVGSRKGYLPPIRDRIKNVIDKWKLII